ncbi:MAG: tetratricopeptide repeat protein [Ignavibacteriaceae bacterium]
MIFVCPSCGERQEKDFKFCPNCGFDLSLPAESEETENGNGHKDSSGESNIVVCNNCGEENNAANDFCSNCGVRLPDKKIIKQGAAKPIPASQKKKVQGKKQTSAKHAAPAKAEARTLSSNQIFMIVGTVLAILAIIMFASGIFDSTPVPSSAVNNQSAPGTETPGVDLSLMPEINRLEAIVEANPDDQESLLQLAHIRNDARLYQKAIETYRQYLEINPSNADARVDMGVCYYSLQDYNTAIAEMQKALEYQPKHQIAHLNLGIVNLTAGNLEVSKEWFRKALEIDPNSDVGKRAQELLQSH